MARNEEKAQSTLNRLLAAKQAEAKGPKAKRPYLASECTDLVEADKWRSTIIREIGKKVMEIQNEGLGEHRCAWVGLLGVRTLSVRLLGLGDQRRGVWCAGFAT